MEIKDVIFVIGLFAFMVGVGYLAIKMVDESQAREKEQD